MTKPFVAVLMGSDSDLPTMQTPLDTLTIGFQKSMLGYSHGRI